MAKNISGEVIDRKEVSFRSVPAVEVAVAPAAPAAPAAPPAPETMTEPATPPAPPAAPAPPAPAATADTADEELPATASTHPRTALMGLSLVLAGLLLARKAR